MAALRLGSALVLCLAVLAVGCSSGDDDGSPSGSGGSNGDGGGNDPYAAERKACVDRINGFRATEGLPPLAAWTDQGACTDAEAKSDSASGEAHGAFGMCGEGAQNECPGWGSIEQTIQGCLQDMWDEGPGEPYSEHGHYINMSNPDYKKVACGFYVRPDGKVWAIQNFR
jgi:hypothetical protein